jgi:hypothetical protein
MTDQNVDIFLEHYGVLGMKWGVRNSLRSSKKQKTNSSRKNKVFKTASVVTATAIGLAIAGIIIKNKGSAKVSTIPPKETYDAVIRRINLDWDKKVKNIHNLTDAGKLNSDQNYRLRKLTTRDGVKALNKAYINR